jgi:hypothetical protein
MEVIRADHEANDTISYCPAWSAANKSEHLAKGKCKLPALKIVQGMKRKPKYLTRFCQFVGDSVTKQLTVGFRRKTKSTAPRHGRVNLRRRSSRQQKRRR